MGGQGKGAPENRAVPEGHHFAQLVGKLPGIGVMDSEPNVRNNQPGQIHGGVLTAMSGSDRNQRPPAKLGTIAAIVVGLASIGGGIAYGLVQQAAYEQEAEREAADYAKHAAHKINQACALVTGAEKRLCLLKANEEYELEKRQNRHDAADLVAQRKSALWTGIMGVAALIGMALSAVGVALVWTTFREQKRATDLAYKEAERAKAEAADNADHATAVLAASQKSIEATNALVAASQASTEAELRAWITVEFEPKRFRVINGHPGFAGVVTLNNIGRTPAKDVTYYFGISLGDRILSDIENTVTDFVSGALDWSDTILFPGKPHVRPTSCEDEVERPIASAVNLFVVAAYTTVFSDERRVTAMAWEVTDGRRDDNLIDFKAVPFGDHMNIGMCKSYAGTAT